MLTRRQSCLSHLPCNFKGFWFFPLSYTIFLPAMKRKYTQFICDIIICHGNSLWMGLGSRTEGQGSLRETAEKILSRPVKRPFGWGQFCFPDVFKEGLKHCANWNERVYFLQVHFRKSLWLRERHKRQKAMFTLCIWISPWKAEERCCWIIRWHSQGTTGTRRLLSLVFLRQVVSSDPA